MHIFFNIIKIIVSFLGIIGIFYIINLILTFTTYIDTKRQDITIRNDRLKSAELSIKCEATAYILKIIDIVIELEIAQVIRTYKTLNTKYEINRLSDDIKKISKTVYKSVKSEIYSNNDCVLTEDYLISYITNMTTMEFIKQVRDMNNFIYDGM
jgi:hypothetical protein